MPYLPITFVASSSLCRRLLPPDNVPRGTFSGAEPSSLCELAMLHRPDRISLLTPDVLAHP